MLTETHLIQEFTTLIERTYPQVGSLLRHCHIKLITAHWGQPPRRLDYIAIYCLDTLFQAASAQKEAFRNISRYMGLAEPVCMNATRLLRDPKSKLKQDAPRFWLELHRLLPAQTPDS
ncbi:hypothetical protein DO97_10235 [Neosynechococcus sphagnicola sy1]|uniref:Uncharacterized protein n=1 Tax=Neosynechococcus sphagnicola sy1 TaxID=1497020 RepID=A0A098TPG4_9CYAN|nr:hypothetical protein [Neosynechococcus sphagnicola]KGF73782.1 hypothetical protein DO97_10235 [Neosynechococcus sphagnicola sy1]